MPSIKKLRMKDLFIVSIDLKMHKSIKKDSNYNSPRKSQFGEVSISNSDKLRASLCVWHHTPHWVGYHARPDSHMASKQK